MRQSAIKVICSHLDTVRSHIKNIHETLEIYSKAELIEKSYDNEI